MKIVKIKFYKPTEKLPKRDKNFAKIKQSPYSKQVLMYGYYGDPKQLVFQLGRYNYKYKDWNSPFVCLRWGYLKDENLKPINKYGSTKTKGRTPTGTINK